MYLGTISMYERWLNDPQVRADHGREFGKATLDDLNELSLCGFLQHRLGAKSAVGFDLAAACSGSVFSLITAQQYLLTGRYKRALVIGAEVLSSFIDWTDRQTCVLFGDGAGAAVLAPVSKGGILATDMGCDGSATDLLCIPGGGSRQPPSHASVDQRLHYLMVGAFATVLALQILVILVLSHPFSGDLAVSPHPILHVVRDFGG